MGSGASKQAATSTLRKFPNRPSGSPLSSPPSNNAAAAAPAVATRRPAPDRQKASPVPSTKDEAIRQDSYNPDMSSQENRIRPDFARRLGQIGVVDPNPTFSPSSTASTSLSTPSPLQQTHNSGPIFPSPSNNLVLSALEARERLEQEAEQEFQSLGLTSSQGRRFLPAGMIRDVLVMRERGAEDHQVEQRFNLRKGVLSRLGPQGLYGPTAAESPA